MESHMTVELLTPAQVAEILNLKRSTVYAAIAAGRLPHTKLWHGRRKALVRVPRSALSEFIASRTTSATPEVPCGRPGERR